MGGGDGSESTIDANCEGIKKAKHTNIHVFKL
jgi:hypothetical protein